MPHYVISTGCSAANYFRAQAYLTHAARGFSVFFPQEQVMIAHAGRKSLVSRPYIPGYAFVEKDHRDPRMIRNCPGVNGIVYGQHSERQAEHVDQVVLSLREHEQSGFIGGPLDARTPLFMAGECLRVIEGPFASFNGIFECETGEQRARVLVSIFGRPTRVELGYGQLEKLNAA